MRDRSKVRPWPSYRRFDGIGWWLVVLAAGTLLVGCADRRAIMMLRRENAALARQLQEQREELSNCWAKIDDCRIALESGSAIVADLRQKVTFAEEERDRALDTSSRKQETFAATNRELAACEQHLADTQAELDRLRTALTRVRRKLRQRADLRAASQPASAPNVHPGHE